MSDSTFRVDFKLRFDVNNLSEEVKDILVSVTVLTVAFSIVLYLHGIALFHSNPLLTVGTSLLLVTTAFLLHELAHRYVAKSYGGIAFFKMWPFGIVLALMTSFFGLIFAAPGAVNIGGIYRQDQIGKTALAGPLTNIILGTIFYLGSFLLAPWYVLEIMIGYVGIINLWFGLFNLIPIPPLDGSKIMKWDFRVFVVVAAVALALNVYDGLLLSL